MNVAPEITLRYFHGCPNWQVAKARLEEALERLGQSAAVGLEQVETPQDAQAQDFRGSPTILVDGPTRLTRPGLLASLAVCIEQMWGLKELRPWTNW